MGDLIYRPIRRAMGVSAFGINAYTANASELIVEEHDEIGAGAGHHEELYVVVTGRATFTVDGETFDAPVGTCVFLDDPKERRAARAAVNGTTVLAIGGVRGEAFRVSPWEFAFAGVPAWNEKRYDETKALGQHEPALRPRLRRGPDGRQRRGLRAPGAGRLQSTHARVRAGRGRSRLAPRRPALRRGAWIPASVTKR